MRLIYTATRQPVAIGDRHTVQGFELVVARTPRPHKPDSEGKIDFDMADGTSGPVYYCSIIGAEWVDREDRLSADLRPRFDIDVVHESGITASFSGVPGTTVEVAEHKVLGILGGAGAWRVTGTDQADRAAG